MFFSVLGPGIITMVADNDAGGISTYSITGAQYGFSLLWILIILLPVAYFIQEMTVRLGAVTKRGHAEAIFEGFGKFWGWFSIFDLAVVNWLTLVTEYIGMTAAMSIFGVPPWITYLVVTVILTLVVMTGRYWTFEKITLLFCAFNLVYIPAAFWAMQNPNVPGWGAVAKGFFQPGFHGGFTASLLFVILANIGTTITPWQVFFQQSSVVDKGLDIKDIKYGKWDTFAGSFLTCLVAAFIIIATGAAFYYHVPPIRVEEAARPRRFLPSGFSMQDFWAPCASRFPRLGLWARSSVGPTLSTRACAKRRGSTWSTSAPFSPAGRLCSSPTRRSSRSPCTCRSSP
jgi:NRAMP (natural resistance-associated macrophage protein)-like metal ion transporter